MSAGEHRIGKLAGVYAALAPVLIGLLFVPVIELREIWLRDTWQRRALQIGPLVDLGLLFCGGLLVAWLQRKRSRRALGRARLLLASLGGVVYAASGFAFYALLSQLRPETVRLLLESESLGVTGPALLQLPAEQIAAYVAAMAAAGVSGNMCLGGCIASWWLLPPRTRARVWIVVDCVLVAAVTWAVIALPVQPPARTPNALALPVLRHVLTAIGVLRLMVRAMPPLLDAIERAGFQTLVAARHLRSDKSGFLATISILSVLAVAFSCTTLTTTLSVMGGFRSDLKRKILGNNAHIVIDRDTDRLEQWRDTLQAVQETAGVAGAAPYVSGEVMLSSASNLATAVMRGIDPQLIGKVNDLPRNLTSGKLEYLDHPEKLLEEPQFDDLHTGSLLFGKSKLLRVERRTHAADAGSADEAAARDAAVAGGAGTSDAGVARARAGEPAAPSRAGKKLDLEKRIESLEAFLRDTDSPRAKQEERALLPGIIIGQELARALRLYVGDEVNVVAPLGSLGPSGPMPKSRPFRVAGIFYSGMYEYDMKSIYSGLETAQKFLGVGDTLTGIEVRVNEIDRAPEIAAGIRGLLAAAGVRVRDWQQLNSRLFGALALEKLAMFITLGIEILVASFCIAGTLILMVQEKGREVAILKAMGTSDRAVVGVFVIEGGLIGVLGAALGLFFGYMLCFAMEHFGIRMNPEVYYIDRLPVHLDATEFSLAGLAAVAVCLVITIYPALLASRLRPVDALRYE